MVTSSPALFSSYQNKKCVKDDVSICKVTAALDLRFPNTSVQYDASHLMKVFLSHCRKKIQKTPILLSVLVIFLLVLLLLLK